MVPTTIVYIQDTQETLLLVRGNRTIWTVNEIIVFKYCIGIFFPVRTKIDRENHFWCSLASFRGWRIFFTHTFLAFFNSTITPPLPPPYIAGTVLKIYGKTIFCFITQNLIFYQQSAIIFWKLKLFENFHGHVFSFMVSLFKGKANFSRAVKDKKS